MQYHTTGLPQSGERSRPVLEALDNGLAAVEELGLTAALAPVLDDDPGAWVCMLHRDGVELAHGAGMGKGAPDAARAGAVFEALEHHLSGPDCLAIDGISARSAHSVGRGPLADDAAIAMLAAEPDGLLPCMRSESLTTGSAEYVPVFLSVPAYLERGCDALRRELNDSYDYASVRRYSSNNGWAAGADVAEATVHALNELVERDALSLLLIDQFLGHRPSPLRVMDVATLPADLDSLRRNAEELIDGQIHLIDMTTDLGIPAFIAFSPPRPGRAARIRGCGASLSRGYAIRRALTEIVQLQLGSTPANPLHDRKDRGSYDHTVAYPALHRCRTGDFTPLLRDAIPVTYEETDAPATPRAHQQRLAGTLADRGFDAYVRKHHVTPNLAVVNAIAPGLERFMIVTDGQVVIPGQRGLTVRDGAAA